jgi:hypothetical protein
MAPKPPTLATAPGKPGRCSGTGKEDDDAQRRMDVR